MMPLARRLTRQPNFGTGYPGGPEIEARARGGAHRFALPRPLIGQNDSGCDFSFSGLKTALRQRAIELQPISETDICDLAAGFQAAIADCLVDRCRVAIMILMWLTAMAAACCGRRGAANQFLRQALDEVTRAAGFSLTVPPPALCTDNGAMIAWAGAERLHAGSTADAAACRTARTLAAFGKRVLISLNFPQKSTDGGGSIGANLARRVAGGCEGRRRT